MQSCPRHDAHEVWHRCALEVCARRFWILLYLDVGDDHFAGRVHIMPEQTRDVVLVFLNNFETASRGVESLTNSGPLCNPDENARLIKICELFSQAYLNRPT